MRTFAFRLSLSSFYMFFLLSDATDKHRGISRANGKMRREIEEMLCDLMKRPEFEQSSKVAAEEMKLNPYLSYYIVRLLRMTRESISELNISSVSEVSLPNIPSLETNLKPVSELTSSMDTAEEDQSRGGIDRSEDLIRSSRLRRAEQLDRKIKEWRHILGEPCLPGV